VAADIPLRDVQGQALGASAGPFHVVAHASSAAGAVDDGVDTERYQLAVRRSAEDWRLFPVTVK
jgi:hypothetical protein